MLQSISASDFLSETEQHEIRFLTSMKSEMRMYIQQRMREKNLSPAEVAKEMGYSLSVLSEILNPDRHIHSRTMFLIMEKLNREWVLQSVSCRMTIEYTPSSSGDIEATDKQSIYVASSSVCDLVINHDGVVITKKSDAVVYTKGI
ncbi:MAG: helix-turn-helix transcriptional regulator [Acetobacter sp.]